VQVWPDLSKCSRVALADIEKLERRVGKGGGKFWTWTYLHRS
jgi:hypothetical protein